MQIPLPCLKCAHEHQRRALAWAVGEISEAGVHEGVCPRGHAVRVRLMWEPTHELVADVGALAFLDGYYREAVSAFAAALEQSFEFYVEASLIDAGIEHSEVLKLLRSNRLDQRRAGMVSVCYLRDTGRAFPYLQSQRTEFRNRVIHNASWPTRSETIEFAEYVCTAILGMAKDLGEKKQRFLALREAEADFAAAEDLSAGREAPATLMRPTFLDSVRGHPAFDDAIDEFAKRNWWHWPGLRVVPGGDVGAR